MSAALALVLLTTPSQASADFSAELRQRAVRATVRVTNRTRDLTGSGAVIAVRGGHLYILTAQHVIEGTRNLEVALFAKEGAAEPDRTLRGVRIVAERRGGPDLALLKVPAPPEAPPALPLPPAPGKLPEGLFEALAVGCGDGGAPTVERVHVVAARRVRRGAQGTPSLAWEVKETLKPGRSGGPLVDADGRLIGIAGGVSGGRGYFSHAREIADFLRRSGQRALLPPAAK